MKLRVALLQTRSGLDPAANRAAVEPFLRKAAAEGARLVATPEMTTRLDRDRARMQAAVAAEDQEAEIKAWGRLAREHGFWLLLGSMATRTEGPRVRNRSLLFGPDGRVAAAYDKINMFDVTLGGGETYRESEAVEAGDRAVLAEAAGAKLGLTICYDLRFPELYRTLAQAGAELIAVPSAFTRPTGQAHWEVLLRARAIENGCFILAPAQGGAHADGRTTWGHTMIVGPWGEIVDRLDHEEPAMLTADLDLEAVSAARARIPAWRGGGTFGGPS